jgi:hypothetical protein
MAPAALPTRGNFQCAIVGMVRNGGGETMRDHHRGDPIMPSAHRNRRLLMVVMIAAAGHGGYAAAQALKLPAGDPCSVLSLSDVQKVFPGAKGGERNRRLEQYGTTECAWKGADGRVVLAVQESHSSGTAKDDVQGMAMGFTDPLKPKSRANVRYETFANLGSGAAAFVEQADPSRGILSDGALLSIRQGEHAVWLMSSELPRRDRAAALKALEELGKAASKRVK